MQHFLTELLLFLARSGCEPDNPPGCSRNKGKTGGYCMCLDMFYACVCFCFRVRMFGLGPAASCQPPSTHLQQNQCTWRWMGEMLLGAPRAAYLAVVRTETPKNTFIICFGPASLFMMCHRHEIWQFQPAVLTELRNICLVPALDSVCKHLGCIK